MYLKHEARAQAIATKEATIQAIDYLKYQPKILWANRKERQLRAALDGAPTTKRKPTTTTKKKKKFENLTIFKGRESRGAQPLRLIHCSTSHLSSHIVQCRHPSTNPVAQKPTPSCTKQTINSRSRHKTSHQSRTIAINKQKQTDRQTEETDVGDRFGRLWRCRAWGRCCRHRCRWIEERGRGPHEASLSTRRSAPPCTTH